jgi:hypothetical protein
MNQEQMEALKVAIEDMHYWSRQLISVDPEYAEQRREQADALQSLLDELS